MDEHRIHRLHEVPRQHPVRDFVIVALVFASLFSLLSWLLKPAATATHYKARAEVVTGASAALAASAWLRPR